MKGGRSNRHDPPEDWVDGSWTVDCVCGVNFDDGEEMVNCDECGVWVHTRCSRYVKGEELFTCDKCKSKNNRNDSEETEVAQLLVELPTKTIRLERNFSSNVAPRRPFKLWTERPMEDRVHVQGIPGGDPALFHGLSSVFTPQLWKCTGYVPKKFNFQYREFPCWDEKEGDGRNEEENENTVDKGAGVLFSLSKESMLATPVAALVGMRGRDDEGVCDMKSYSKDMKRLEVEDRDVGRSQIEVKRDRSLLQPVVIHSGKRKKEDLGKFNYQSGKKKVRAADKEMDLKKRGSHVSKTALTSTNDSKTLEFYEDRGLKGFKNDTQSTKNQTIQEHEYDGHVIVGNCVDKQKNNSDMAGHSSEAFSFDAPKHICSTPTELKEGKVNGEMPTVTNNYPKVDNVAASGLSNNDVVNTSLELEGVRMLSGNKDDHVNNFAGIDVKPSVDGVANAAHEAEEKLINGHGDTSLSSIKPSVKSEGNDDMFKRVLNTQHSPGDAKDSRLSYHNVCEKVNDATLSTSSCSDHKAIEVDKTLEVVGDSRTEKPDELIGRTCLRHELEGSEASMPLQKCPSESKCGSVFADELLKSEGTIFDSPALTSQRKMVVCIGKSSSTSSMIMLSKTSASDNLRSADTLNSNPDTQRAMSEGASSIKKDQAAGDVVRDSERHETSRKIVKEHSKSSVNSVSKTSNSSKISHTPVPKRTVSDSKGSSMYASPKPPNSGEISAPLQSDTSHTQNKAPSSGLPLRAEKFNQSHSHSSSKANHVSPMNPHAPTSSPATLSDEELALLLHQELNSSPRVPRVPRVRNAGSIPQLASPTATSMLVKCTSSSAGKDHSSVFRRKSKDASKAGFHHSQNSVDETKRAERVPSSPDQRRHGIRYSTDGLSKREDYGSAAAGNSTKKNMPPTSTSTANSGPSSSTEVNDHHLSSMCNSPRNMSEEEAGTVRAPVRRTLPGLINEIMSKGKRMTYEELCNAVLPHWHNLRKHNGERYAYSSHSQAVLDCLRNRQEWARLVDRGPKTNSSRKKRRLDTEESEEIEYRKGRTTETKSLESQKEEFPKGKRKARKRRRLALQGRGIKDVRNKRKAGMASDDDSDPFSNTSGETLFSDEEIQGGGAGSVGSETSSSSDDASSM